MKMNGFKNPFILLKDLQFKEERGNKNDNDRFNA